MKKMKKMNCMGVFGFGDKHSLDSGIYSKKEGLGRGKVYLM